MSNLGSIRQVISRRRRSAADHLTGEVVLRPVSAVRSGQVLACSASLLAAGLLLTRGFIGVVPGRPVYILLGVGLAASAVLGLAIDHVEVRSRRERPDQVLIDEVNRSRRFGHTLAMVSVTCSEDQGNRLVGRMRGTDRAWRQRGSIIALLPETDSEGTTRFVGRLADLVDLQQVRVAVFPDDAVTVDGLYEVLRRSPTVRPLKALGGATRPDDHEPVPQMLPTGSSNGTRPAGRDDGRPKLAVGEG